MAMIKKEGDRFVLSGNKHKGKTLREVAEEDPNYLAWMWNDKSVYEGLSDESAYHLEDLIEEFGIEIERKKR